MNVKKIHFHIRYFLFNISTLLFSGLKKKNNNNDYKTMTALQT